MRRPSNKRTFHVARRLRTTAAPSRCRGGSAAHDQWRCTCASGVGPPMYRSKLRFTTSSAAASAPLQYREIGWFAPAARPARDQRATLVAGHRRCSAPRRRCRPAVSLPLRVLGFVFELGLRVQEERRYSQCFRAAAATASLVEVLIQARGALNSRRSEGQMPALAALMLPGVVFGGRKL